MIALIAMFVVAVLVIGLGAYLLGSRRSTETVSGGAGAAGDISAADGAPDASIPAPTDAITPNSSIPPIDPALTDPGTVDSSVAARTDLELHFDNHARGDLEAAYAGLTDSFAPDFEDFARFWGTDVASVESPIDGCLVSGDRGVCTVRFFITYSDAAADESVRSRCLGQRIELTMQRVDDRFLIDEQRELGPLDCPAS